MNPAVLRLRKALEDLERVRAEVVPPTFGIVGARLPVPHYDDYEETIDHIEAAVSLVKSLLASVEQETKIMRVSQDRVTGRRYARP